MKEGQELVCIRNGPWRDIRGKVWPGPKYNDIVTFDGMDSRSSIRNGIFLKEYTFIVVDGRASYDSKYFKPVISTKELEEQLSEIFQEQKV